MNMEEPMNHSPKQTAETEIDRVLSLASVPELPVGAVDRLMARLDEPMADNILLFRPPSMPRSPVLRYATALPLAASLALGIYLGAMGTLDFALPSAVTGDVASSDDNIDDFGGVGEAEQYAEDNLS